VYRNETAVSSQFSGFSQTLGFLTPMDENWIWLFGVPDPFARKKAKGWGTEDFADPQVSAVN